MRRFAQTVRVSAPLWCAFTSPVARLASVRDAAFSLSSWQAGLQKRGFAANETAAAVLDPSKLRNLSVIAHVDHGVALFLSA